MQKYIHKKTGKLYRIVTDNFMIKNEYGGWKNGYVLYEALYLNPDAKFFARTSEDFFSKFEKSGEDEPEPSRVVIEKELCNPVDAYDIPGPYYHVCVIDSETGEKREKEKFEKDIKEAARYAERMLDIDTLEVAYRKSPDTFKSTAFSSAPLAPLDNCSLGSALIELSPDNITKILSLCAKFKQQNEDSTDKCEITELTDYIVEHFLD